MSSTTSTNALFVVMFCVLLCITTYAHLSSSSTIYNDAIVLGKGKSSDKLIQQIIKKHVKKEKRLSKQGLREVKITIDKSESKKYHQEKEEQRLSVKEKKAIKEIEESEFNIEHHTEKVDLTYVHEWLIRLEKRLAQLKEYHRIAVIKKSRFYKSIQKEIIIVKKEISTFKREIRKYKKTMKKESSEYEEMKKKYLELKKKYEESMKKYMELVKQERIAMEKYDRSVETMRKKALKMKLISKKIKKLRIKMKFLSEQKEVHNTHTVIKTKVVRLHHYYFGIENPLKGDKCLCPVVFKPVCGADGRSYSSACVARCAGAKIGYEGKCKCIPNKKDLTPIEPEPKKDE